MYLWRSMYKDLMSVGIVSICKHENIQIRMVYWIYQLIKFGLQGNIYNSFYHLTKTTISHDGNHNKSNTTIERKVQIWAIILAIIVKHDKPFYASSSEKRYDGSNMYSYSCAPLIAVDYIQCNCRHFLTEAQHLTQFYTTIYDYKTCTIYKCYI